MFNASFSRFHLQDQLLTVYRNKYPLKKALTHYKDFHKDFSKKIVWKIVGVVKKVVVCIDDNYFFSVSVVVCEGLKWESGPGNNDIVDAAFLLISRICKQGT